MTKSKIKESLIENKKAKRATPLKLNSSTKAKQIKIEKNSNGT